MTPGIIRELSGPIDCHHPVLELIWMSTTTLSSGATPLELAAR